MLVAVIALIVSFAVLYKTRFGLRLRACGEHPQAADSVGINVYKMRYAGVMISGVLGGLGGIAFITAGVSVWKFEYGVAGFGFLALAVMIFGGWSPVKIALAAILFGFFRALGNVYSGFDFLLKLNMPSVVYNMLPYFVSLIVLAFTSKKSRARRLRASPTIRVSAESCSNRFSCSRFRGQENPRLSKNLHSRKFRREEKRERKPSGCPFTSNNPPQRQNCKIMLQNLILQF